MSSLQESLSQWAAVLGTALSILNLFQTRSWLAFVSLGFLVTAVIAGGLARANREILDSGNLALDNKRLDCLNAANLTRRVTADLIVQEAFHLAQIEGANLTMTLRYSGYCNAGRAGAIEFTIDAENNTPFEQLDCLAFDLTADPSQAFPIRPLLVSADGFSKKIAVPFARPLSANQHFNVQLHCRLPDCMRGEPGYFTATTSFAQRRIDRLTVQLEFVRECPAWVRVYDWAPGKRLQLVNALAPRMSNSTITTFADTGAPVAGQSVRVYSFSRLPPVRADTLGSAAARSAARSRPENSLDSGTPNVVATRKMF